ncbi:hypoxia- inducible factor prolyl hydroxylase [Cystoisospora suis]|uniref:Hypoxia-inducible factor prolyl hydroxylase n=1 Tax=Cystoisospora suis TaxID=483139 RepID=A0A2C6KXE7_9APIC|nr:hypoxia- inducible factor prolyl hydroxylase [Cystoisospora suis]
MESKSSPLQNSDRTRAASETIREKDKEEEENERDVQKREKMKKEEEEEKTGMSQKGAVDAKEEEEKKEKEGEEKPNGGVDLSTEKGRSMTEEGEKIRGVCTPENREEREENKKDEQLKKEEKENLQREEGRKSEDSVKMNGEKEEKKMSDISSSSLASSLLKQVMEVKAGSTNVNLSQSSSSSSGVRTPAAVAGPSVVWEKEVEDAVIAACLRALNYSTRKDLERRTRSGTGTEDKGRLCCGSETSSCCRGGPGGGGEEEENYSCSSSSHSHSHHHDHAGGVCTPEGSRKTSSDKGGEREEAEGHPHRREKKEDQDRSPSEAPSPDLSKEKEEQGGGGGRKTDKEDHEGHRSRTSRSGGQESFASSPSLSAGVSNVPVYKFQKDKGDHIGALLDENTSIEGLRNLVGSVAERAAAVYENVKAKGEAG